MIPIRSLYAEVARCFDADPLRCSVIICPLDSLPWIHRYPSLSIEQVRENGASRLRIAESPVTGRGKTARPPWPGDVELYPVLDRTRPGRADEHLGLFHQTLVDHLLARGGAQQAHRAIVDSLDQLAPADRHDPKTYRDDPLLAYAFDAGPRHRWEAGQSDLLVAEL